MKFTILATIASLFAVAAAAPRPRAFSTGAKKVMGLFGNHESQTLAGSNDIQYHGGPVFTGPTNTYGIFYGTWTTADEQILTDFISGISSTTYFNIEKTYTDANNNNIAGPVSYTKSVADNYSKGKSIADQDVLDIITGHIAAGDLPEDKNAVYFLFTSSDVAETSGFCSEYCGWHNFGQTQSGAGIAYAFIGNPESCLAGCSPNNQNTSPNGNPGVDAMVSVTAHELMEAMSDVDPINNNAWSDSQGQENADKCAYQYGTTYNLASGAIANIKVSGRDYLIQENWSAATQSCQLSA